MNISIAELFKILIAAALRRRNLIIAPIIIFSALAVLAILTWPRQYQAHALLMLQEGQAADPLSSTESRQGRLKAEEIDTLLKSDRVLAGALNDMNVGKKPLTQKDLEGEIRSLRKQIDVSVVGSEFIDVEFKQSEREGIGERLSIIMTRFFEHLLTREYSMKTAREFALEQRRRDVASTDRAMEDWISRAEAFGASNSSGATKPSDSATRATEGALPPPESTPADSKLAELQKRHAALEQKLLDSAGSLVPGANLSNIEQMIGEEIRIASSRSQVGAQGIQIDPPVDRINALKELAIDAENYRSVGVQIARLRTEQAQALAQSLKQTVATTTDKKLIALYGEWESLAARYAEAVEQYDNHLKRAKKSMGPSATPFGLIAPEQIRIIDEPRDPALPITSVLKILVACIGAGLGLGAGLAVLAEQLDGTIYDSRGLSALTGVDAIYKIPKIDVDSEAGSDSGNGGAGEQPPRRSRLSIVS